MNPLEMLANLREIEELKDEDLKFILDLTINNVLNFTDEQVRRLKTLYERYIGYGYEN